MLSIKYLYSTRVVTSETDVLKLFRKYYSWKPKRIYAFYNSELDKIITQQHLMLMPIDERIATRAHAASNILSIRHQKIINMKTQVWRLFEKAKSLAIQPCMKQDMIQKKILDTVKAAFQSYLYENTRDDLLKSAFSVRIIFSSGHGDFGIAARDNGCVFYVMVYEPQFDAEESGVKEFTTREINSSIQEYTPQKINEVQNAMMVNEAKKHGGFSGIKYTKDRVILQSSAGNLGFVFDQNQLIVPRFEKVVPNTLIREIKNHLDSSLNIRITEKDVTIEQAYTAKQIMIFSKDKIVPVVSLNNHPIGEGKTQLTHKLQKWCQETILKGTIVQI